MLTDAMGAHVDVANRRPGTEFSLVFPLLGSPPQRIDAKEGLILRSLK
jgi:hypothetical protein